MERFRVASWLISLLKGWFMDDETPIAVKEAAQALNAAQSNLVAAAGSFNTAIRARIDAQAAEVARNREHAEAKVARDLARAQLNAALDAAYTDPPLTTELPTGSAARAAA